MKPSDPWILPQLKVVRCAEVHGDGPKVGTAPQPLQGWGFCFRKTPPPKRGLARHGHVEPHRRTRRRHRRPSPTCREAATPALIAAIRHGSGQSAKVEAVLWSCWNGDFCDALAGLDANLAKAVVAMISARAHLAGDADDLLREIIRKSGSQPLAAP